MKNLGAIFLSLCMLQGANSENETADLVLTNGTIITMDASLPQSEALAIRDDKIVWLGSSKAAPKAKRTIDLKGRYVYPGLIDSHAHITGLGTARVTIDLVGTADKESI